MHGPLPPVVFAILPMLVTGCVIFPHGELMAPSAQGKVVDSDTRKPLQRAKVVRRIQRLNRERVTFADGQGHFAFKKDKDLGWLLMVDYAANQIHYRIESSGYQPFETNLYGGGSFYRGTVLHDLGVVPLHKELNRSNVIDEKVKPHVE